MLRITSPYAPLLPTTSILPSLLKSEKASFPLVLYQGEGALFLVNVVLKEVVFKVPEVDTLRLTNKAPEVVKYAKSIFPSSSKSE